MKILSGILFGRVAARIVVVFVCTVSVFSAKPGETLLSDTVFFAERGEGSLSDTVSSKDLEEVVVTGLSARQRIEDPQLGAEHLELSQLALTPSMGGENDLLKSIALLPGVRSEGDGGGGFEVRGGTSSQNLVMLDGIPLFNPSHVLGIFSTFNDRALGRATLFKGPFPASYGGAVSSVLDTSLAPGDMEEWHASGTVGILAAKIKGEGPIVPGRLSMAVAARRSYVDAFLKMVPKYRSTVMNFYDVSAKLRFKASSSNMIDASFFMSRDNMAIHNVMGMYWGNLGASLNWISNASGSLSFTTAVAIDRFNPRMLMSVMEMNEEMKEFIHTYSINEEARLSLSSDHRIDFGLRSGLMRVKSGEWTANGAYEKDIRSLWENAVWVNYSGRIRDRWEINSGVRLNLASTLVSPTFREFVAVGRMPSDSESRTYVNAEPRFSMLWQITPLHSVKAGIGMASQNLHAIRSGTTSFPFDRYALTSAEVRPEQVTQYGLGYAGMTSGGDWDWSAEGYYRQLRNVYDYRDGRNSFSDINLQDIILGGRGRSYGGEFMLRKNTGRLTGWIAYTVSHTQTRITGVNGGKWYDATSDRRHDLALTAIFRLTGRWTLSGTWIFSSGQPLTAPDVKYTVAGVTCYYYSMRNAYRTPPVHRLDLSATYTHIGRKLTYQWTMGIFNAYCRYNPYVVYFEDDPTKPSGTRAVQQAMYGFIPSVAYTLTF